MINVIKKAASEQYRSVAFPAIGCGEYGCSINLVAQTFVRQIQQLLTKYPISVLFVIQPERMDVYEEFREQIRSLGPQHEASVPLQPVSLAIEKGIIEIIKGDITKQTVILSFQQFEISFLFR